MDLRVLSGGWRRHLKRFGRLGGGLAGGQDPKVFCLSCCDSRVSVHEIFDLPAPGSIFEVKNVGGLFSDDARAALVYALGRLDVNFIVLLHHSRCGGYLSLEADDGEPEVRKHMVDYGGYHAKVRVEGHLMNLGVRLPQAHVEQLIVEEGCRTQMQSLLDFLIFDYPGLYEKVKKGEAAVLPLLYDVASCRVYRVPQALEGSEDMIREEL
jgi:carbonic anhydrase